MLELKGMQGDERIQVVFDFLVSLGMASVDALQFVRCDLSHVVFDDYFLASEFKCVYDKMIFLDSTVESVEVCPPLLSHLRLVFHYFFSRESLVDKIIKEA